MIGNNKIQDSLKKLSLKKGLRFAKGLKMLYICELINVLNIIS